MNDVIKIETQYGEATIDVGAIVGVRVAPGKAHAEQAEWDAEQEPTKDDRPSYDRPTPTACTVTLILSAGLATATIYSEAVDGISDEARRLYGQMVERLQAHVPPSVVHEHRLSASAAAALGESAASAFLASIATGQRTS